MAALCAHDDVVRAAWGILVCCVFGVEGAAAGGVGEVRAGRGAQPVAQLADEERQVRRVELRAEVGDEGGEPRLAVGGRAM